MKLKWRREFAKSMGGYDKITLDVETALVAWHRRGSATLTRHRCHWRIDHFDTFDAVHFAGGISMD